MNQDELNRISSLILDCSIEVHKQLGLGLLESVYEICLFKDRLPYQLSTKEKTSM